MSSFPFPGPVLNPPSATPSNVSESLVVLSDLHLGSDLLEHAPEAARSRRSKDFDADFVELLDHYRREPPPGGRWRLVIAGDLFDFIGMSLRPDGELVTAPTEEELAHGLGNSADHAVAKIRAIAARHGDVFGALSRFVAAGHALTIIHGNHDLALHWAAVREELLATLLRHARSGGELDETAFLSRVEFTEWFFYRDGVAYIEHGHQYDPFCATHHVLSPLSPVDPARLARGFSDVLLRYVVRQTPGLPEHGHEDAGLWFYVSFALRLGVGGGFALVLRYIRAIRELFRLRRAHLSGATKRVRRRHERAMRRFAALRRIHLRKLRKLADLSARPITSTVSGILASLLVDKILLWLTCAGSLALILGIAGLWEPWVGLAALAVPALWLVGSWRLAQNRPIDPVIELAKRARELADLFSVPFVVMGHSHVPTRDEVAAGRATYFNVGSWTEEQGERTARTHLVIHPGELAPRASFLRWDRELGPTELSC